MPIKPLWYQIFGMGIRSEVRLRGLPNSKSTKPEYIDVKIRDLRNIWGDIKGNKNFVINQATTYFSIPKTGIFLVKDGEEIIVSPENDKDLDKVSLYILGTCMGIILMQRRILPLHGSAISIDGKTYAIVGDSGAGKSTLASAFLKRGYKLLSDDVIPVSFSEDGIPMVTPAYPQQKLWQESMDHFGLESSGYEPIIDRETKFKVPVVDQFEERQLPLAGVIELTKTEDDQIHLEPIQDLYRFSTLYNHTYRSFIIRRAGLMDWHFETSSRLLPHIEMFHMRRPVSQFTANELVDKILNAIGKEESVV